MAADLHARVAIGEIDELLGDFRTHDAVVAFQAHRPGANPFVRAAESALERRDSFQAPEA